MFDLQRRDFRGTNFGRRIRCGPRELGWLLYMVGFFMTHPEHSDLRTPPHAFRNQCVGRTRRARLRRSVVLLPPGAVKNFGL